ncbi:hypothetical protein C0583_03375 [Candidatus Parcubacteria bacterium]|nr:MAG: hypothetical protein C0583_03375 [Candidatus Parcubacteria bacterium]
MHKRKVLIGEDEKNISEMYKIAFEKFGYNAVTASNGKEVIDVAQKELPDIVLLDINMPIKDGFQVLKDISEQEDIYQIFRSIPVVILSNYNNPQDIDYCMRMGAQDYIIKSEWTPADIVKKIDDLLNDL